MMTEFDAEPLEVYCVLCIASDGDEVVHIFTTPEKAQAFVSQDGHRDHVTYPYLVDHPERMDQVEH